MTLMEINKNYEELVEDMNRMTAVRDSLLGFYDSMNKYVPDNLAKIIADAVKQSGEYRDMREMFMNRVNNFESRLTFAGYSPVIATAIVKEFKDFLKKN